MLYALGTLPDSEIESFEALARKDRSVQQLVHEYQRVNEVSARAAPTAEPPFQAYSRIMAEIEGPSRSAPPVATATPRRQSGALLRFAAWSGWGLAACAAVALGLAYFSGKPAGAKSDIVLNTLANPRLVAVKTPSDAVSMEDRMFELSGLAEAYWFSREGVPEGQLLTASSESAERPIEPLSGGFTIFDNAYQIGYIAVENLPQEQRGKSYHVWAKTKEGGQVVRAGSLPIGNESRGLFFFDLSSLPKVKSLDQVTFFVTEEATEDPEKPGPMVVLSQL